MSKSIEIDVKLKSEDAQKGFDAVEASAKELQERLADLDASMKILIETQGQNAYVSQQGLMIQRERKFALENLLSLQEEEEQSIHRTTRGYGGLAASILQSTTGMSGFSREVSTLTTSLLSGSGMIAALSLAAIGIKALVDKLRNAKEEMEDIKRISQDLIKIQTKEGFFNVDPKKIPEAIALLEKQLATHKEMVSAWTKDNPNEIITKGLESAIEKLKEYQEQERLRLSIMDTFSTAGLTYVEKETKAIEKRNKALSHWSKENIRIATGSFQNQGLDPSSMQFRTDLIEDAGFSGEQLRAMEQSQRDMENMYRERQRLEAQFIMRTASVFTQNMTQAWGNIFGEANSMFEQMIQSWAQMFFQEIGTSLISSFIGAPGAGDIFSFSRAINSGNTTASKYRVGE